MQQSFRESINYRGYVLNYGFIISAGVYVGEVLCDMDTLAFGAANVQELMQLLKEAVDGYIAENDSVIVE